MKYLVRSVKYFFYFSIICALMITALVLIGAVEGNVNAIFDEGHRSIVKIAVFFLLVAAVYPKFGFITREIPSGKNWNEIRDIVVDYMTDHHYELETETPEAVTFRIKGFAGKLTKMYEDRITLSRTFSGWSIEGLRKDAFKIASAIENRLNAPSDVQ